MSGIQVLILFLAGLAGGTAAGLFGIGGGVIYVLVYNIYFGKLLTGVVPESVIVQLTILNAACSIFVAASVGSYRQHRHGRFFADKVIALGLASAAASFVTTRLLSAWQGYDQRIFLIVFTIALLPLIFKFIPRSDRKIRQELPLFIFPATGIFTGIGSALSGLGGGFISNPVLHGFLHYPLRKTFSISLGSMIFTTIGILAHHTLSSSEAFAAIPLANFHGIIYSTMLPVVTGVLIGTPLGIRLHHRFSERLLSWLFFALALAIIARNLVVIAS